MADYARRPKPLESISVVVGTYNGAMHLREQLASIFAQQRVPCEILISDDRSTDETLEIAATFVDRGIPLRLHQNSVNLGFADNFLEAVRRATGDYIAFCDQDDIWYPNKLQTQFDVLRKTGASACVHKTDYVDATGLFLPQHGSRVGRRVRVRRETSLEPWGNFLGNTVVIKRELFDYIPRQRRGRGPWPEEASISHDRWAYALAAMANGIAMVPDRLSAYRLHENQLFGLRKPIAAHAEPDAKRKDDLRVEEYRAELAMFRIKLLSEGAPAKNVTASTHRWSHVRSMHLRAASLLRASSSKRTAWLVVRLILGDYLPTRLGGLGHRTLVSDLKNSKLILLRRAVGKSV